MKNGEQGKLEKLKYWAIKNGKIKKMYLQWNILKRTIPNFYIEQKACQFKNNESTNNKISLYK